MAYEVRFQDGRVVEFNSPPTDADIEEADISTAPNPPTQKEGFFRKIYDVSKKPEQLSREGLTKLTEMVSPSMEEIESGKASIPGMAVRAAGETLAEVAPSFISPESLATSGALKAAQVAAPVAGKAISATGKYVGKGLESLSGLSYKTPGVLAETVKDPSLFFAKGKDFARTAYESASDIGNVAEELKQPMTHQDFISKALELAKNGQLGAEEALQARKSLDAIRKSLTDIGYKAARNLFDTIAKTKFAEADVAFQRGVKGEALRTLLPMNKTGKPSIAKTTLAGFISPIAPFLSPVAQGAAAATVGVGKMVVDNPATRFIAKVLLSNPKLGFLAGPIKKENK